MLMLLALGPAYGICINALIYLPLFVWLIHAPYGSAAVVARDRVLLSMTVLIGASSFFVGNAYQAQMLAYARDLGHGRADFSYSMLLAADAGGGLIGVFSMSAMGPRTFSGLSIRLLGAGVGIHNSLALSASVLLVFIATLFWMGYGRRALGIDDTDDRT